MIVVRLPDQDARRVTAALDVAVRVSADPDERRAYRALAALDWRDWREVARAVDGLLAAADAVEGWHPTMAACYRRIADALGDALDALPPPPQPPPATRRRRRARPGDDQRAGTPGGHRAGDQGAAPRQRMAERAGGGRLAVVGERHERPAGPGGGHPLAAGPVVAGEPAEDAHGGQGRRVSA